VGHDGDGSVAAVVGGVRRVGIRVGLAAADDGQRHHQRQQQGQNLFHVVTPLFVPKIGEWDGRRFEHPPHYNAFCQ